MKNIERAELKQVLKAWGHVLTLEVPIKVNEPYFAPDGTYVKAENKTVLINATVYNPLYGKQWGSASNDRMADKAMEYICDECSIRSPISHLNGDFRVE